MKGSQLSNERSTDQGMGKQLGYFDPITQSRIRSSLMYFGTGLAGTGVLV
jgi:hypothetical protein